MVRTQQSHSFAVLKFQRRCSGEVHDRQDATVMLIRCAETPGIMFRRDGGFQDRCLPTGHFPQ
eukprot:9412784-Pyramimonas_sp.AAC.1